MEEFSRIFYTQRSDTSHIRYSKFKKTSARSQTRSTSCARSGRSKMMQQINDVTTGRSVSATSAFWSRGNQPGFESPRPERPAAASAPESRECPPGSSSRISPRAPLECSVSSEDVPSTGPVAAVAAADLAAGPANAGDAGIPSAACAHDTRGSWPGSSSPQCWPSSRRYSPSVSATWTKFRSDQKRRSLYLSGSNLRSRPRFFSEIICVSR